MDDGYEQTIHGLLRKRSIMAGQVEALRSQIDVLIDGLNHIDAAIRLFKPDIDVGELPVRPVPPPNAAFRGEVQRFLLDTLRKSGERLKTSELARAIMLARRLDTGDRILAKLIERRTGNSLRKLKHNGFIDGERWSKGAELEWFLVGRGAAGEDCGGWANGGGRPRINP